MKFYDGLVSYYDDIFPLAEGKVAFVKTLRQQRDIKSLLDVGCATGTFCNRMADLLGRVDGFDLDKAMVVLGADRYERPGLRFRVGNMLESYEVFEDKYDLVTCFGNTLVHLDNEGVLKTLRSIRKALKGDGIFLGQILNYNYVFEAGIKALPIIDNEVIRFDRTYEWQNPEVIEFTGKLTVKETGEQSVNTIELSPISKEVLESSLIAAGFTKIHFYKNYKADPIGGQHLPLIVTAES